MCNQLRQPFAFLPGRSDPWIRITKPKESSVQELISGRRTLASALPIEGPAKHQLRRAILFSGHLAEPMVDQR